jgi:hypothetical protein
MFNSKESLYINAIKYDTQLKLDYKELEGEHIVDTKSYVHLVDDEILAKDIAHKINLSQEDTPSTYISTLLLNDSAFLVKKDESLDLDYEVSEFNDTYDIAIAKTTLFETKHYFNKTGIDYIYSAFHILNLHVEQNSCNNELLVFLFNNRAFLLVLDKSSSIVYSSSVKLPSFDDVKDSQFYEDDIVGQKLYDEIYYLELHKLIEENLNSFYKSSKSVFVEKISVLYAIKQLEKEQIETLKNELYLDVEYHPINIDEEIFELSKDKHQKKSFIKPRHKERSNNNILILIIIVLLLLISLVIYKIIETKEFKDRINTNTQSSSYKSGEIILPDHVNMNDKIEKSLKDIFTRIPYDTVLDGFVLYENSAKLNVTLLKSDSYIKSLEPELKTLFKKSSLSLLEKEKKISQKGIVLVNNYIKKNSNYKKGNKQYIIDDFLPKDRVLEQLNILFPENTIIKFKKNTNSKFISYEYYINIIIDSPSEIYNIIDNLNKELYSIYITYPIKMNRLNGKIETEFTLIFNQHNN